MKVNTLSVLDGGLVDNAVTGDNGWAIAINLRGSTIQSAGGGSWFSLGANSSVNSLASDDTSEFAGQIRIREGNDNDSLLFSVEDGAAATDLLVSAVIEEQGAVRGITKAGPGTMALTGFNSYSGPTIVNGGVLAVGDGSLNDAGSLVLDGGTIEVTGIEVVDTLFFGGVQQASGTWGAPGNGAADHTSALITGSGLLDVVTGAAAGIIVTDISREGNVVSIEFSGGNADVYSSPTLQAPVPWTQIGVDVAPSTFVDDSATEPKKFYSVVPVGTVLP